MSLSLCARSVLARLFGVRGLAGVACRLIAPIVLRVTSRRPALGNRLIVRAILSVHLAEYEIRLFPAAFAQEGEDGLQKWTHCIPGNRKSVSSSPVGLVSRPVLDTDGSTDNEARTLKNVAIAVGDNHNRVARPSPRGKSDVPLALKKSGNPAPVKIVHAHSIHGLRSWA
jgi:hypothetical protein